MSNPEKAINNRYLDPIIIMEIKAFLSLMILTGILRASREPIKELYSDDLNFGRPILGLQFHVRDSRIY